MGSVASGTSLAPAGTTCGGFLDQQAAALAAKLMSNARLTTGARISQAGCTRPTVPPGQPYSLASSPGLMTAREYRDPQPATIYAVMLGYVPV